MTESKTARVGQVVGGKYRISRFIAEGGMGSVYEGQHLVVKRRFALKFLHTKFGARRETVSRFRREAIAAGSLESDNIAAAVDLGVATDGIPFIVMEYLEGIDLSRLLARVGPLPVERATEIVLQACRGVQAAHARDVIHRDLKPKNLVLCRRGEGTDWVKVVDFGLAKLLSENEQDTVTGSGGILGTAAYMSPEQARGDAAVDHRTDIYSLGAILYELLSGRVPHPGDSYNAVIHHILTQAPQPLPASVPEKLGAVIERALSFDARERQPSARALAAELEPFAQRKVWPALDPAETSSSLAEAATLPASRAKSEQSFAGSPLDIPTLSRPAPRRFAVSVALFLVLVIGSISIYRASQSGTADSLASLAPPSESVPRPANSEAHLASASKQAPKPAETPAQASAASTTAGAERPSPEPGRPLGRPLSEAKGSRPPLAQPPPKPIGVQASFDPNNPYE